LVNTINKKVEGKRHRVRGGLRMVMRGGGLGWKFPAEDQGGLKLLCLVMPGLVFKRGAGRNKLISKRKSNDT